MIRAGLLIGVLCVVGTVAADEPIRTVKAAPDKWDFQEAVWNKPLPSSSRFRSPEDGLATYDRTPRYLRSART
jgi:hypothetical protein